MNKDKRSSKSVREKSMKIAANILKLSSISIAKMSLGTVVGGPPAASKKVTPASGGVMVGNEGVASGSGRAVQEAEDVSKPISFLIEAGEEGVDGKASDYIRKVHEKNRFDLETSNFSSYILN